MGPEWGVGWEAQEGGLTATSATESLEENVWWESLEMGEGDLHSGLIPGFQPFKTAGLLTFSQCSKEAVAMNNLSRKPRD